MLLLKKDAIKKFRCFCECTSVWDGFFDKESYPRLHLAILMTRN